MRKEAAIDIDIIINTNSYVIISRAQIGPPLSLYIYIYIYICVYMYIYILINNILCIHFQDDDPKKCMRQLTLFMPTCLFLDVIFENTEMRVYNYQKTLLVDATSSTMTTLVRRLLFHRQTLLLRKAEAGKKTKPQDRT